MALVCSNCGVENADSSVACRRCRVPFDLDAPAAHAEPAHAEPAHAEPAAPALEVPARPHAAAESELSGSLGEVCRSCEAYNEPGRTACSNCGVPLASATRHEPPPADPGGEDLTPQQGFAQAAVQAAEEGLGTDAEALPDTPPHGMLSLSEELSSLALSDEDAREAQAAGHAEPAGQAGANEDDGEAHDVTPREGFGPVRFEPEARQERAPAVALPRPDAPRARPAGLASPAPGGAAPQRPPAAPPAGPPPGWV